MKPSVALTWATKILAGLMILSGFLALGRFVQERGHLPLSPSVIGLALIAALLVGLELRASAAARKVFSLVNPSSRLLISHLGLLFIPAGVGVMTQSDLLRSQWLPIVAALLGSTWAGIAVTGWVMQRMAPAGREPGVR